MKPLVAIALAIAHCRPSLPKAEVDADASIIEKRSKLLGIDPILIVGLIKHESGWDPTAVNKKSGALGYGQILPQFRSACAQPSSAACSVEKKRLLDGAYNLSAIFDGVEAWQRECTKKTGKKTGEIEWTSAYAGLNKPKTGEWCGWRVSTGAAPVRLPTHSLVKEILDLRAGLHKWLASHPQG